MITIRKSNDRGHANWGWLDTYHTFSFADYFDRQFMHFRSLRVINEDMVAPGRGFDTHPHKDMEILTYIISGQLQHKDSMGHQAVIKRGEIQKISAGTGIEHSEYNASSEERVHLVQIWILPDQKGMAPSYDQISLQDFDKEGLLLIASSQKASGVMHVHQDAHIFRGYYIGERADEYKIGKGRGVWIQMITGQLNLGSNQLLPGDGASIEDQPSIVFTAAKGTEFLLFDLK